VDAVICNIHICAIIIVIKYDYYLLSTYEVMGVFHYYLNLYARLNNAAITICMLQ
jgi:hypothetical protein